MLNAHRQRLSRLVAAVLAGLLLAAAVIATEAPRLVHRDGGYALLVDGKPFLMLGAQVQNSSSYPKALDKVWAAVADLQANTVEVPTVQEQVEPVEGRFDFSFLDTLREQARERQLKVVLLWFGTWKNTRPQYTSAWVKFDNRRCRCKTRWEPSAWRGDFGKVVQAALEQPVPAAALARTKPVAQPAGNGCEVNRPALPRPCETVDFL